MLKDYDVIVVGSGPAGFAVATTAARRGKSVVVLERNEKFAKKIYATGNGKCNYANTNSPWAAEALEFTKSIGIIPLSEDEGRLYPRNRQAASVVKCMEFGAANAGVKLFKDFEVASVQKNGQLFEVKSKVGETLTSDSVVIATGGKAGIQFGCYGDGFKWATEMGIKVVKPIPALCGLEVEENIEALAGVRVPAAVQLLCNGAVIATDKGEVQFTKNSVSGICVMNLARNVRKEEGKEFSLKIDLFPEYTDEELLAIIFNQIKVAGCGLEGIVPREFHDYVHVYAKLLGMPHNPLTMSQLCKNLCFKVTGTKGWKDAQVTSGGVDFEELDDSYQSKIVPGLYFAGEVLNYDGPCGGYNITFAIASGVKVGNSI